jgi:hypothetical protein
MTSILNHIKSNAIAYLALFVALGGTSYAAINLPAGSVGKSQIQNHAIDPVKLNPNAIGASIRAWADVAWDGAWRIRASSRDIRVASTALGEVVRWRHTRFARNCMASVTPERNIPGPGGSGSFDGYVTTAFDGPAGQLQIDGVTPDGTHQVQDLSLLIICPSPGSQNLSR